VYCIKCEINSSDGSSDLAGWTFQAVSAGSVTVVSTQDPSSAVPTFTIKNSGDVAIDINFYSSSFISGGDSYAGSNLKYVARADGNTAVIVWTGESSMPTTSANPPEILTLAAGAHYDIYLQLSVPLATPTGLFSATFYIISSKS